MDVNFTNALDDAAINRGGPPNHHAGVLTLPFWAFQTSDGFGIRIWFGYLLAGLGKDALELLLVVTQRLFGLFNGDVTAANERFGVKLTSGTLGLNEAVHQRLRHRRIIALIVPAAAVAHHVYDDVLVKTFAI